MEIVLPQGGCQLLHDMERHMNALHLQGSLHAPNQPLHIGHGIVSGGGFHDHIQGHEIVEKFDAAFLQSRLAILKNGDLLGAAEVCGLHSGLVGAGDVRHEHGAVGDHLAVTAEPPAGIIFLVGDVAAGNGVQLTLDQLHTAFAAGAVAGARGIDGHISPSCQLQQIISGVAFNLNRASALDLEGYFH